MIRFHLTQCFEPSSALSIVSSLSRPVIKIRPGTYQVESRTNILPKDISAALGVCNLQTLALRVKLMNHYTTTPPRFEAIH